MPEADTQKQADKTVSSCATWDLLRKPEVSGYSRRSCRLACDWKLIRGLRGQHSRGVSLGDVANGDACDLFHGLHVHGRDVVCDRVGDIGSLAVRRERDPS